MASLPWPYPRFVRRDIHTVRSHWSGNPAWNRNGFLAYYIVGFAGGLFTGWLANEFASQVYPGSYLNPLEQLFLGGFAFAAVFMASDPVTAARTTTGKYIYGFMVGVMAVLIRTYNTGYPEGAMLAVLFMNCFAPLIDYCVVHTNMNRRTRRLTSKASRS